MTVRTIERLRLTSWLSVVALVLVVRPPPSVGQIDPARVVATLGEKAQQLEDQGGWREAAATSAEILRIDPYSIPALNGLGAIDVREGKFDDGIKCYQQALEVNPSEFGTNLDLGIAYIKQQEFGAAIRPLQVAVETDPSNFQAQELLGVALAGHEDFADAIPHLKKATELNQNDIEALYFLERSYRLPRDATARFSLGFMSWKLRRFQDAESELQETLRLDSHFDQAEYYLADIYLMAQQPEKALPLFEKLSETQRDNVPALLDPGKALEKAGRYQEAVAVYQRALRLEPNRADAHYQLAQVFRRLNKVTDYQRELERAEALQAQNREREASLLDAVGARGDPTKASANRQASAP